MSTNYYLQSKTRTFDGMHICQIACGWEPMFEAHEGFKSIDDLKELYLDEYEVIDEHGRCYSFYEFMNILQAQREHALKLKNSRENYSEWVDKDGNLWTTREFS